MKNIVNVVMAVLLAAAIISGFLLFREYRQTKRSLAASDGKLAQLHEMLSRLNEERSKIGGQAAGIGGLPVTAAWATEPEGAAGNVPTPRGAVQENTAPHSDQTKLWKATYKSIISDLDRRMEDKDSETARIVQDLESAKSKILTLMDEISKGQSTLAALQKDLSELPRDEPETSSKAQRLQSSFQSIMTDLNKKMQSNDAEMVRLVEDLEAAKSRILSLSEEIAKRQGGLLTFQKDLSELRGQETEVDNKKNKKLISQLNEQIKRNEMTIKEYEQKLSLSFVDRVLFDFGKSSLSPQGERLLAKVGQSLRHIQGKRIKVVGHTDSIPIGPATKNKFASNWELSAVRAAAVVRFLQEKSGLNPRVMEAVGRSYHDPIASNETPEGRAQNRRVEIIIAPELELE